MQNRLKGITEENLPQYHKQSVKQRTQTQDFENPLDVFMIDNNRSKGHSVYQGQSSSIRQTPEDAKVDIQRQNSIASSFQNLSLNDGLSINDSQYSIYNPSINEPFVPDDADPLEKEMHAFLDQCGIFQINIKQQLDQEKKSTHTASSSRRSFFQTRKSPSFFERRNMRIAQQAEQQSTQGTRTTASSSGVQSQKLMGLNPIMCGGATFSSDMFKQPQLSSKANQVANSVKEEEPATPNIQMAPNLCTEQKNDA